MITLTPDWQGTPTPFNHTWERFCNIDQFHWMTRADVLDQLEMAHRELGSEVVRAVGMFDDKMRVYAKGPEHFNQPNGAKIRRNNFQIVDYVIDRLQSIGMEPLYTTSFCPSEFTDGKRTIWDNTHVRPPKDMKQWSDFVTDAVRHNQSRYGSELVRKWTYEVWNEPNLENFWAGTQQEFFEFWDATYRAIKGVDPDYRVGGPSTARGEWLSEFLQWTAKHETSPDFIITHCYNNDSESEPLCPYDGPASSRVKDSPGFFSGVVRGVKSMLDEYGYKGEVHWNEWGRSWFPVDTQKESPLEAAFIVKSMSDVSQSADQFAYWCLSDVYDQAGYNREAFCGHYGMLSQQGLRKPSYHAHQLLRRLGNERIACEGGGELYDAIVTPTQIGASILVYNYPQNIKDEVGSQTMRISIPQTPATHRVYRIQETENNILAHWREMGSPDYLSHDQLSDLKNANGLQASVGGSRAVTEGDKVFIETDLECPGVALIELAF